MIQDQTNITRMLFDLRQHSPAKHWQAVFNALIEDRYSDGEWPRHKAIQTAKDIRALGHSGLAKLDPKLNKDSIDWFMGVLGAKRKSGRPKKMAA